MIRLARSFGRGVPAIAVACLLLGCDPYGAYCEDAMGCRGGNDSDVEACIAVADGYAEKSSLWDCDEYWDELFACVEAESRCVNGSYTAEDRCEREKDRYGACM